MSDDDNALKDVDLSAWDVPAPETSADELADGVIARLEGTDVGAAIPVEPSPFSTKKRALLIAGVAAAVLAAVIGGFAIVKGTNRAAPRDGAVIAQKAQTIELDGAHADLDAGADVRWKREGSILHVEQRAGSAAWRVGTDSKLVIDAGAAVASVEATGASLRVEVKPMNAADVRIAGALTATAVMVAVVVYEGHVKVHDTVTQQTVIVQPGSTYTVRPPGPITDDEPVVGVAPLSADQPPEVTVFAGASPVIHDMQPPTRVKIDMRDVCKTGHPDLVVNGVKTSTDQFAFNRGTVNYKVTCADVETESGSITVVRDSLTRPMAPVPTVNEINADGRTYRIAYQVVPAIEVHGGPGTLHVAHGTSDQTFVARGESVVIPAAEIDAMLRDSMLQNMDGTVSDLKVWFTPDKMSTLSLQVDDTAPVMSIESITWGPQIEVAGTTLASSALDIGDISVPIDKSGRFKATVPGGGDTLVMSLMTLDHGTQYAVARKTTPVATNAVTVASAGCDAQAEMDKGMESVNIGAHAAALAHFEASLTCKTNAKVVALAYMSACNSMNEPKARLYYGKLSPVEQTHLAVICMRNKIDPASQSATPRTPAAPANCDADALKQKGMENVDMGQHAAALGQFELSLRCKDDPYVRALAFMAACNAQNAPKAKLLYGQLSGAQQAKYKVLCVRNHIDPTEDDAAVNPFDTRTGAPANCDADALKDKGMDAINMGNHAEALDLFEKSLACKNDSYVLSLAFMASCNAQDGAKAKQYYAKLTPAQQNSYRVMCDRNHVDVYSGNVGVASSTGYLEVTCTPEAKVLVDSKDTGLTTPISGKKLALDAGKHKLTLVVGQDRFTYPFTIEAGKTVKMSKDLR